MTAQPGNEMLIKIGGTDSSVAFSTIGGMTTNRIVIDEQPIDVTTKGTTDPRWRDLLEGGAPLSIELSGSGVFKDGTQEGTMWTAKVTPGSHYWYQFLIPGFKTITGKYLCSSIEYSGEHDGAVNFSATFMSNGTQTLADV